MSKKEPGSSSSAAASDIPSTSDPTEIDEELYCRQLAVYGIETMRKLARSNVHISGLSGLGAEIAKNLVVAGVKSVTLHDDERVQLRDLSSNFFLSEDDVGKNRALACVPKLQELNHAASVSTLTDLKPSKLSDFQAVVFTDISLEKAIECDDYCHNHEPPIAFIKAEVRGLFGNIFCDFGPEFTVVDVDGVEPHMGIISFISNGDPAEVLCVDNEVLKFHDGDHVVFSEVLGMTELNDQKVRRIKLKDVTPQSFTLEEDTASFGRYEKGGIVTQVKQPKVLKFKPLRDALKDPGEFLPSDFSKFNRLQLFHLAFQALDKFRNDFGRFPAAGSSEDADKLIAFAGEVDGNIRDGGFAEIDTKLLNKFSSGSGTVLTPMAAVFGGIVGEEVVKACSGKFHPLHQFFYFQSVESLPMDPLYSGDLKPQNCRYDDQILVFGPKLQKQLEDAKVFIVGSDVLECELLKNLALMGVCCSPEGKLIITDDNFIEKSNLGQQFLFRERNIGEAKSTVAADAGTSINPSLHVEAFQIPVRSGAEDVFNDAFWRHLDVVCAPPPPNVEAYDYTLSRCLYFQKPLLMSQILGTTCNTAMVIPHLTQYYGMFGDTPVEKNVDYFTIHYFPYKIDHCFILANDEFENLFVKAPNEVNSFVSNPSDYISSMSKNPEGVIGERLKLIADCILGKRCQTFHDCVSWATLKFEYYFIDWVKRLTSLFPEDATYRFGAPIWRAPKRFPEPLDYSLNDPQRLSFIKAASILRAETFGIPIPGTEYFSEDFIVDILMQTVDTVDTVAVLNPMLENNMFADLKGSDVVRYDIDGTKNKLIECLGKLPPGFQMKPVEFEKGDNKHHHMVFIAGLANFRARNYRIPEVDNKLISKVISGRLLPSISSSAALAAGFVCLELYKVLAGGHRRQDYCNLHANLVTPAFSVHKPLPPKVSEHLGMSWTVWDHWDFNEDLTLGELLQWLHEKHIHVNGFKCDGITVYSAENPILQERPDERVVDIAMIVAKVRLVPGKHLQFQIDCRHLGDLHELGYDITKTHEFHFVDEKGILKTISDDARAILLADQLREQSTITIFVESNGATQDQPLPEVLAHARQEKRLPYDQTLPDVLLTDSGSDDEERLIQIPITDNNSDEDAEIEEARNKVRNFVELKKSLQHGDQIDEEGPPENDSDDSDDNNQELDGSNDRPGPEHGKVSGYESHNKLTCPKRSKSKESTDNVQTDAIPNTLVKATAHKGKNKSPASTRGPVQILRARRNSRAVEETSQHTTSDFGAPEISTQQSMTNAAVQEDPQS
ncbi:hypothetical protein J5N97_005982 [Dioscorea zingiberensis]|uniref:E1 ubiquitin-activating enzyme n=1 Tax=Dioscorea zingiberensis TaxID=325984 RepID=A0A9D5D9H8_9LILI|nr:hypothetical protein J5N97_005982 [Dioscorea zingiberensis]